MELKNYLEKSLAPSTIKRYQRELEHFFSSVENPQKVDYKMIMEYIGKQRKTSRNISVSLSAIKKYFSYLVSQKIRKDNPASSIRLRDSKSRDVQLQDLFKTEELEQLLNKKERYLKLKTRNKITISLLIYQGLTNGNIIGLELKDVNLEEGTIYIKSGRKINARTLKLKAKQVFWLMKYIETDRKKLLKSKTEKLIISNIGKAQTTDGISYLIETFKGLFKNRNLNPRTIRQSVITNLLKEKKDLRIVQTFAGHRYPSTTENYKQTAVEELKIQVLKYHPLG